MRDIINSQFSSDKRETGFTIVELLIAIVVIAILAAISFVAYNGIQDRAKLASERSQLEVIVKSIKLYVANGGSMTDGVAGASNGRWYGGSGGVYGGSSKSMMQALKDEGYLPQEFDRYFMMAPCTSLDDQKRMVMIRADPIPSETPEEQIAPTVCNPSAYTNPDMQYKMNMVELVF